MLKIRGFTIIEILTTITILGIVASIAAPEYYRLKDRDDYRAEGQGLFDTLLDARNAALTNRFCDDGSISVRWAVAVETSSNPISYQFRCYSGVTTFVNEAPVVEMIKSELEEVDFNENSAPAPMDGTASFTFPDSILISFFSGGGTGRIDFQKGTLQKADSLKMIVGHNTTGYQHTICFNRVSGFPTFNKTGNTCQTY